MRNRHVRSNKKQTLLQEMVRAIKSGTGAGSSRFPGWRVTKDNDVELDYDYFKDHFQSKEQFAHFFKEAMGPHMTLPNKLIHVRRAMSQFATKVKMEASAFKGALASYELTHVPSMRYADYESLFRQIRPQVMDVLKAAKFQATWYMTVNFGMRKWGESKERTTILFVSKKVNCVNKDEALRQYITMKNQIPGFLDNASTKNGSGWVPDKIVGCWVNVHKYDASRRHTKNYFALPGYDNHMCGLVNVKNSDNMCFVWTMLAALHPAERDPNRVSKYKPYWDQYWQKIPEDLRGVLEYQGMLDQSFAEMERIFRVQLYVYEMITEKQSPTCAEDWGEPYLIYRPVNKTGPVVRMLKAVKLDEDGEPDSHFVLIKNVERFLSRHMPHTNKEHFTMCEHCFRRISRDPSAPKHDCDQPFQTEILPPKHETIQWHGWKKTIPVPLLLVADFEALNCPVHILSESNTERITQQKACSYGFLPIPSVKDFVPQEYHSYTGEDCAVQFLDDVVQYTEDNFMEYINKHIKMKRLTIHQEQLHEAAETCVICEEAGEWEQWERKISRSGKLYWKPQGKTKVRHHDHDTGKYLGAAHNKCNILAARSVDVVVAFHNLKGYDSHFLMRALRPEHGEVLVLADNSERIKTFSLRRHFNGKPYTIRFIDTWAFMQASLDTLATSAIDITEDPKDQQGQGLRHSLPFTTSFLNHVIEVDGIEKSLIRKMCLGKGVYPYEYVTSLAQFDQDLFVKHPFSGVRSFTLLPEHFHSHLNAKKDQNLLCKARTAEAVSRAMGFTKFRQYHDFYLARDVYLLADLFQNYRKTCLQAPNCGLDPCHFFGNPSMVYNAFLKNSTTSIELIQDTDLYQKYRKHGMRGGLSYWRRFYTKANNRMHPEFDPTKPISHILDMDATSLYPWAGRQRLPVGDFEHEYVHLTGEAMWEYINDCIWDWPEDEGCYLWVDIELPVHASEWQERVPTKYQRYLSAMNKHFAGNLHDYQENYPVLIENKEVPTEWLHPRQKALYEQMGGHTPTTKLINDLLPKKGYMIHYLSLRLAIERGWVPTAIHEIMTFRQEYAVRDFLDECISLRASAKNPTEKQLQKNNMNSLIGKFIEDVMRHSDFRCWDRMHQFTINERKGRLKNNWYILNEDKVLAEVIKKSVRLDKPIMMGIAVYDISKLLMASLWYTLQDHYGRDIELCGGDTDSMIFRVFTDSWEKDVNEHFNSISLFPTDHPLYKSSRFSDTVTEELLGKGINPYVGIFDQGEKYLKSIPAYFKEDNSRVIEVAALKSKMYSLQRAHNKKVWVSSQKGKWQKMRLNDVNRKDMYKVSAEYEKGHKDQNVCKGKGLPQATVEENMTHSMYRDTVLHPTEHMNDMVQFSALRPSKHEIYLVNQTKVGLRPVDDKRWSCDGLVSLPHGHHLIKPII